MKEKKYLEIIRVFLGRRRIIPLIFLVFSFYPRVSFSQFFQEKNRGVSAGMVFSFGTHVQQMGFFARTYWVKDRFQWNTDLRLNYYLKYLGPKTPHPEIQLSSGIVFGYGKRTDQQNFFWGKTDNQTLYQNSVAYAYNIYINKIRTSQQTGTIVFQFNHIFLGTENDILARPLKDRFRTAAILLGFQKDNKRISVSQVMWTGRLGHPVKDSCYRSPAGYLDTTGSVCPLLSHGLLYVTGEFADREYLQQVRGSVGIDAEQVRHAIQNRFMHDGIFLPKKLRNPNNYHFPMIDDKGCQYLFRPGQNIRKPHLYFNLHLNPDLIY